MVTVVTHKTLTQFYVYYITCRFPPAWMHVRVCVRTFQISQTLATLNLETVKTSNNHEERLVVRKCVTEDEAPTPFCPTGKKVPSFTFFPFDYYVWIWGTLQRLTGMLTTTMSPSVSSREAWDHWTKLSIPTAPSPWFNVCPLESQGLTMSFYQRRWCFVTGCCWLVTETKLLDNRKHDAAQADPLSQLCYND